MASHASYVPHVAARFPAQKYLRLTKDGDVKQFLTAFSPGATSRNGMVQSNLRKHLASTNLRNQTCATKLVQTASPHSNERYWSERRCWIFWSTE